VGDSAGELTKTLEALRLIQLPLELLSLAHVLDHRDPGRAASVHDLICRNEHSQQAAVFLANGYRAEPNVALAGGGGRHLGCILGVPRHVKVVNGHLGQVLSRKAEGVRGGGVGL
jgi:hypothetical protein